MVTVGRASFRPTIGLPPGGTADRILTKTSTNDYHASWTTVPGDPVAIHLSPAAYLASQWYDNRVAPAAASSTSFSPTTNYVTYVPVYMHAPIKVTALGFYQATSVSGPVGSVGLSQSASSGLPGTVLATTSFTLAGLAAYTGTFSPVAVPAGWNWLSIVANGGIVPAGAQTIQFATPLSLNSTGPAAANTSPVAYYVDSTSSAIVSNPTVTATKDSVTPVIWFQVT